MKTQNEELKNEIQRQNEKLKTQNEELKNEVKGLKAMISQMMLSPLQELTQMMKVLYNKEFVFIPPFNGQNKEVDIVFP